MKKIFMFIVVLCIPAFTHAAWYDNAWEYRIELQAQDAFVSGTQSDMPLYIDLSLLDASFFAEVQADGSDIIMTASDEVTPLDYELVELDVSNKSGELHFKSDSISDSSDTSFYLYYGNNGTNTFISGNVWNDYQGVWHFQDDINANIPQSIGVATLSAIDGGDGGWAVWYGNNPIFSTLSLAIDEDQVADTERAHTNEQVAYWVFENGSDTLVDINGNVIGEIGQVNTTGSTASSVSYTHAFTNPVVVATAQYVSGVPAVVRMDNLDANGFDIFLQNPTPSAQSGTANDARIHYMVLESGAHILEGNVLVEAGTTIVNGVNNKGNWDNNQMQVLSPSHSFVNPVVLGSVQTFNNTQWQTFWSSDGTRQNPPSATNIYVGRHTGETTVPTVVDETLGYIIVESHAQSMNGFESRAAIGGDTISGVDSGAPFLYPGLMTSSGSLLGFSDSTVNNFHTSLTGAIDSVSGALGRAADFNGSSKAPISGLNYGQNNSLDEITASFWINTTDTARSGIFDFDRSEYWELGLNFHNANGGQGKISFDTASSSGGIQDMNSATAINDGSWHYVVAVFDAVDQSDKKIYIDGQLDASLDQHGSSLGTGVTRYGLFGDGSEDGSGNGNGNNLFYEGLIDEARIEHRVRDASWIKTLYNNQSDNGNFWNILNPEQQNLPPESPTELFFNHSDAQSGGVNPTDIEIGGANNFVPYFSALYNGDGDQAQRAYLQVTTDPSFATIDYWDSGWLNLASPINDTNRSENIEYGVTGANPVTANLTMDDGNVTYYWRIAFEDDSGLQGSFSNPASFTLLDTPTTPGMISALKQEGNPDTFIVNWQDTSVSETSFEIEFQEDTGSGFGAWQEITLPIPSPAPANTTTWGMENTVNNAAYRFRVRSCNYANCSAWLEDVLTHFTDPEAPVNVCSEYLTDTNFNITWENRAVFDESSIEQCNGADCLIPTFTNIASNENEPGPVSSMGTLANNAYRWSVFADNGAVRSQPTYSPIEYTQPSAPIDVQAVRISDSLIELRWTDTSDYEDGFSIFIRENGASAVEITPNINTVSANQTSYTYTGASAGNEYQFEVRAHIAQTSCGVVNNASLLSDPGVSNMVVTTPEAPLITSALYRADNDVDISWIDQSSYEDGFNIFVRNDSGPWALSQSVSADTTVFNYALGLGNEVYDFYVEAFTHINNPGNPDVLTRTLGPAEFRRVYTQPVAPVLSNNLVSSTSAEWSLVDNADYEFGVRVYNADSGNLTQQINGANVTTFTETGLTPNTLLRRLVRSFVENSGVSLESSDSNIVDIYTLANSPTNPIATEVQAGSVEVTWLHGGNPNGTEFYIENIVSGINSGWVVDLDRFEENNLRCETDYEYILKARNGNAVETGEEHITITTSACPSKKGGSIRYVCSDTKARNYSSFGRHDASLCIYNESNEEGQAVLNITENETQVVLGSGQQCGHDQILTQNLRSGDRNGRYSSWQKGVINEVKILQAHMNRLGFESGPEDGILGPLTNAAIKRMQVFLGTDPDGYVGPVTRSLINTSCGDKEVVTKDLILDVQHCPFFTEYYELGDQGGEISKIQTFLLHEGFAVESHGVFDTATVNAIVDFQNAYHDEILKPWGLSSGTGRWYQSTRKKANEIAGCPVDSVKLDNGITI